MNKQTKFKVGDKAHKPKGYKFPCTIVGVFETINGDIRVVGEMDEYGLLHIFNEDQLEHYNEEQPDLLNDAYMGYYWIMGDKIKLTKDEFIKKCKTDPEFSQRWGLKIEERELSHDERFEVYKNSNIGGRVLQNHITAINFKQFHFDEANIPTKLITIKYNDKKIESYE